MSSDLVRTLAATIAAVLLVVPSARAQTTAAIQGTVTDSVTAAPLSSTDFGIFVSVLTADGTQLAASATNASGFYQVAGLAPGIFYVKVRTTSSYIGEIHDNIPCVARDCTATVGSPVSVGAGATAIVNFPLTAGGGFSGTVRQGAGGPGIQNVNVAVFNASTSLVRTVQTGADGSYAVVGLPAGQYFASAGGDSQLVPGAVGQLYGGISCPRVPLTADGGCRIASGTPITVGSGTTTGIDFALVSTGTISGSIVEQGTGVALTGVGVELYIGEQRVAATNTGTGNTFALVDVPPGAYRLRTVAQSNHIDEWNSGFCVSCPGARPTIAVAAGQDVTGVNFTLAPGARISGTITCPAPIPGGWTIAPVISAYNSWGILAREVGPLGTCTLNSQAIPYVLEGLPVEHYYLVARDPLVFPVFIRPYGGGLVDQLYAGTPCVTTDCDPRRGVRVTVDPGAHVTGIDFPMATGAESQLVGGLLPPLGPPVRMFDARGVELTNVVRFAGGFVNGQQVVGVPPGTYYATLGNRLHGRGACANCPPTAGRPIVIQPGQLAFTLDFTSPSTATLSGTVRSDPGTEPLSTITVEMLSESGQVVGSAITNAVGGYSIPTAGPGTYYLRTVNDRGFVDELYPDLPCPSCDPRAGTPVVVAAADVSGIDFSLAPGGLVSGRVTTQVEGFNVPGAPVSLLTAAGVLAGRAATAADGRYRLTLPAGSYRARVEPTPASAAEIFEELPCTGLSCDATAGTPIAVTIATETASINFTPQGCAAMTLIPAALATGVVGRPYRQVFTVSGGGGAFMFRINAGTLPAGLALTSAGVLSGTPTSAGRHEISIGVIDGAGCTAARLLTLDVQGCAFTLSPASASVPAGGAEVTVTINDPCGPQTVDVSGTFVTVQSAIPGQVVLGVPANAAAAARSAAISIGRRAFVVNQGGSAAQAPFGTIDGPLDGTQVSGSVAVGGWALDDLAVRRVQIYRDPVGGEAPVQVYLGDAVFVAGARPDVRAAYPRYPSNDRAGWGFLILTNMLPNQGNGAYRIYAYAEDAEGLRTLLGARTIVGVNSTSVLPFGAIDTPAQGATIAGASYINFGWALTPQPKIIPTDGSTIHVLIDGLSIGAPVYNHFRADVATLFPGLANTGGAVGYRILDTTALAEGQHTIAWYVADNQGAASGIGSRYFTVANSADAQAPAAAGVEAGRRTTSLAETPAAAAPQIVPRATGEVRHLPMRSDGMHRITLAALESLQLQLEETRDDECRGSWAGYLVDDDTLATLPVGASLDPAGTFYWQPGPGFKGTFELMFVRTACDGTKQRLPVRVRVP